MHACGLYASANSNYIITYSIVIDLLTMQRASSQEITSSVKSLNSILAVLLIQLYI